MKKSLNILLIGVLAYLTFSMDVYAYCPLGPDVTKDLHGLLKIINYAAPLLCIIFSVIDVLKTVTKGDVVGGTKPVVFRLLKRMMYTVILFFIPVLVDQFMVMSGVWDQDGGCDLESPEDNGHGETSFLPSITNNGITYTIEM